MQHLPAFRTDVAWKTSATAPNERGTGGRHPVITPSRPDRGADRSCYRAHLKVSSALGVALVAVVVAFEGCDPRDCPDRCLAAVDARDWAQVERVCTTGRRPLQAALGHAWRVASSGNKDEALALAGALAHTEYAADAVYLTGYMHIRNASDDAELAAGRELLWQALFAYQGLGRHAGAASAAGFLSRVPRPSARFADALYAAEVAVMEATRSGDARIAGAAETALAEVYDRIGLTEDARESFFHAEQWLISSPDRLAFAYLKHGLFLLDLGTDPDLRAALRYLEAADEQLALVAAAGGEPAADVRFAVHLNRADALAQLGDLDAAARALAVAPTSDGERRKLELVEGYVAARRGDLLAATAKFAAADDDGELELDYRWRVALEIAEIHHRAGRLPEAERALRDAIAVVEELRQDAGGVEIRPWVLARRSRPYLDLLGLLVEQGRGLDALTVAESLHARAWLDVVLGDRTGGMLTADEVLLGARVRDRNPAEPALAGQALLDRVGDREALVFISQGDHTWRAHVRAREVTFASLSPADLAAVAGFRDHPGDAAIAERAAAALLPASVVASDRPLYIVAGGPLADVPFAALRRGGRYLIEDRSVARLPGLAALACRPGTWTDRRVFVGDSRGDLPLAAAEVRRLAGANAQVGAAATLAVVSGARDAALLHAAVHGRATAAGGAIDLADGPFTAAAVLDARIAPRVVILTGCATATSPDAEAWGGFPSAFLAAGSRHVVATLRSVTDADAAAFARLYYDQLDSLDPIARLAAAQRAAARDPHAPAAWSTFAVWGVAGCD